MNTNKFISQVADFHKTFRIHYPEPKSPYLTNRQTNELRPKLIREELQELHIAIYNNDRIEQLDALADTQYVLSGAVLAWGLRRQFEAQTPTIRLVKIRDMDAHLAAMLGMVAGIEIAAENEFPNQVLTGLSALQSRLLTAVYHLGFSPVFMEAFDEVHRSNMSKLWDTPDYKADGVYDMISTEGGKWIARRGDGKIIKSPSYSPADLGRFF